MPINVKEILAIAVRCPADCGEMMVNLIIENLSSVINCSLKKDLNGGVPVSLRERYR